MNVLMIARRARPAVGGVETHIEEVSKILGKKHTIRLVTEKDIGFPHFPALGLLFIWLWFIKNKRLVEKADLVHAHDVFIWYLPLRFLFPKKPVYVTFHGWEGKFPVPLRYKLIKRISARLAWGNICVGKYIEKWYGVKANYVTYGGVKKFKNQNLKIKNTNQNSKILVFVGRLEGDTGLTVFLKALQLRSRIKAEFVGDGRLRGECEKYGKVHGFVPDIKPYLTKAILVFASGYLSMLEALSAGKPVIVAYDNPLKRDYFAMSPFKNYVIMEKDPRRIAKILGEKRRVEKAKAWAKSQTWDKVADLYQKLWKHQ